jgi:hypothetical protein
MVNWLAHSRVSSKPKRVSMRTLLPDVVSDKYVLNHLEKWESALFFLSGFLLICVGLSGLRSGANMGLFLLLVGFAMMTYGGSRRVIDKRRGFIGTRYWMFERKQYALSKMPHLVLVRHTRNNTYLGKFVAVEFSAHSQLQLTARTFDDAQAQNTLDRLNAEFAIVSAGSHHS